MRLDGFAEDVKQKKASIDKTFETQRDLPKREGSQLVGYDNVREEDKISGLLRKQNRHRKDYDEVTKKYHASSPA